MNDSKQFKRKDADSYDGHIENFDAFTDQFSGYAVDEILARIPAKGRRAILDIGCGSGVVSIAAAKAFGSECRVTGIDLSAEMLAFAEHKAKNLGLGDRLEFMQADAEALDLPDASFDTVVSLYAWRHLPDPVKAIGEALRVLRPGGTLIIAVGSAPSLKSIQGLCRALTAPWRLQKKYRGLELNACGHLDALVEKYLAPPKQREIADWTAGHHSFSGSMNDLFSDAGLVKIKSRWIGRSYSIGSSSDYWRLQSTFSTIARKRIAEADQRQIAVLKAEFHKQCAAVQRKGGTLRYRVGVSLCSAIKR